MWHNNLLLGGFGPSFVTKHIRMNWYFARRLEFTFDQTCFRSVYRHLASEITNKLVDANQAFDAPEYTWLEHQERKMVEQMRKKFDSVLDPKRYYDADI